MVEIVESDGTRGTLDLEYSGTELISARQMAAAIDRIALSFGQFARSSEVERYDLELVLVGAGTGSAWANLVLAAKDAIDLWDAREVLAGFMTHMDAVLAALMGRIQRPVSASDRKTVQTIGQPVAEGQASQVIIQINGDNNQLIIVPEQYHEMRTAGSLPSPKDASPRPTFRPSQSQIDGGELLSGDERPREQMIERPGGGMSEMASMLTIGDEWYARPAGLGGVLVPAQPAKDGALEMLREGDVRSGFFERDARGFPVSFRFDRR